MLIFVVSSLPYAVVDTAGVTVGVGVVTVVVVVVVGIGVGVVAARAATVAREGTYFAPQSQPNTLHVRGVAMVGEDAPYENPRPPFAQTASMKSSHSTIGGTR